MKRLNILLLSTALAFGLATAAQAKTLVYCSEGGPEGFDPALYTAGTTFDASSRTSTTGFSSSSTAAPNSSRDWPKAMTSPTTDWTTPSTCARASSFGATDYFTPTRDMNADDVVFSFERQSKSENPWHPYVIGAI